MNKYYKVVIPISKEFDPEWNGYEVEFQNLFTKTYSLPFTRLGYQIGSLSFKFSKVISDSELDAHFSTSSQVNGYLEFTFEIDWFEHNELQKNYHKENIEYLILNRTYNSILLFNIAKPGLFHALKGYIFFGDQIIETIEVLYSDLFTAIHISKKLNWPSLEFLDYELCWKWYFKFDLTIDKISSNSIGRAINAFSHLFTKSNDFQFDEIFWSLIALEALYCKGTGNLQKQLNEKTEIFLGPKTEFKKSVSKLYDFRSKFIHGELDFTNKFLYDDMSDEFSKFYGEDYSENSALAKAIIIATFQRLIKEKRFNLDFETRLVD